MFLNASWLAILSRRKRNPTVELTGRGDYIQPSIQWYTTPWRASENGEMQPVGRDYQAFQLFFARESAFADFRGYESFFHQNALPLCPVT